MNFKQVIISVLLLAFLFVPIKALASQYGEIEINKEISLDKKVKNPNTNDWVDNLFASDYKFKPGQEIEFKINIKNVGNKDLDKVEYRDTLPAYLTLVDGSLSSSWENFKVDETKEIWFKAKVVESKDLPNDSGLYCVVNTAYAWIEGGQSEKDTAQVCIEKKVLGFVAGQLPEAGPTSNLLWLFGAGIIGLTGFVLIRKSYN